MKLTENQREWFIQRYCTWVDEQDYDLTKEVIREVVDPFFDDFQIGNEALRDALLSIDHRQVALSLLAYLYVFKHDSLLHINPTIQDHLAEHISVTGFMNAVKEYPNMVENAQNALEDLADDMFLTLMEIRNHEQIGAELGLEDETLGVYDALRGYFSGAYSYNALLATREMLTWLSGQEPIHSKKMLETYTEQLLKKHNLVTNSRLACEYISGEILQWTDEEQEADDKQEADKQEGED